MRPVVRLHFQDMALALALAVSALACQRNRRDGQNPGSGAAPPAPGRAPPARGTAGSRVASRASRGRR